jgi:dTMP kinase
MGRGKLIVIEGADGTGKKTQLDLVCKRIEALGRKLEHLHFPKHDNQFGKVVDAYLRGELGSKDVLSPEFIALLYITDFYESKLHIEKSLEEGKDIVLSRFFSSTLNYQVALEKKDKDSLWEWIRLVASRLPQPDLVLVLDVPIAASHKFMDNANRAESYKKGKKRDQHEEDLVFQQLVRNEYERNIKRLGWVRVDCTDGKNLLPIEAISEKVWKEVSACLSEGKTLRKFFR